MQYATKALEKAIELPWELLDDTPAGAEELAFPMAEEIRAIIREKTSGGTK